MKWQIIYEVNNFKIYKNNFWVFWNNLIQLKGRVMLSWGSNACALFVSLSDAKVLLITHAEKNPLGKFSIWTHITHKLIIWYCLDHVMSHVTNQNLVIKYNTHWLSYLENPKFSLDSLWIDLTSRYQSTIWIGIGLSSLDCF